MVKRWRCWRGAGSGKVSAVIWKAHRYLDQYCDTRPFVAFGAVARQASERANSGKQREGGESCTVTLL